jgi:homopolymeric O-antigen transport system permease protein
VPAPSRHWFFQLPSMILNETTAILRDFRRSWRVLWALTFIEGRRKYAGSILGTLWYPMYSVLLLGSYCFVYLVVFKLRFKDLGTYDYVLFVFAGLIPYLGFTEAVSTSSVSVRQSLHTLKNAVFPIEFVPVKFVCASLFGMLSSLAILFLMVFPTQYRGWHVLYLPVAVAELVALSVMFGWLLSAITVFLPDLTQVVNIVLLLLMFLSPIGYSVDMVPEAVRGFLYFNPIVYLADSFRYAMLGMRVLPFWMDVAFLAFCLAGAAVTGTLFRRLSPIFADYE